MGLKQEDRKESENKVEDHVMKKKEKRKTAGDIKVRQSMFGQI